MSNHVVFHKSYDGESIVDIERDVQEAFDGIEVELDERGFAKGTIVLTIEYIPEHHHE